MKASLKRSRYAIHRVEAGDVTVLYREAGAADPAVMLLDSTFG